MAELGFRPWQMHSESVSLHPGAILTAFLPGSLALPCGGNSARTGPHVPPSELHSFLSVALPEAFQWCTSGSPLPLVGLRTLNARATLVLFSYHTSFPEDTLFSLGLKRPLAINIKNPPSEKSSFLRSLWGLEFLSRPCYIWSPLSSTSPLCAPTWVCFQHQSDLVFCSDLFILIVCPYCCRLWIEWSGTKIGPHSFSHPWGDSDSVCLIFVGGEMKMLAIHRSFAPWCSAPLMANLSPPICYRASHRSLRPAEARNQLAGISDPAERLGKVNSFGYGLWLHCFTAWDGGAILNLLLYKMKMMISTHRNCWEN